MPGQPTERKPRTPWANEFHKFLHQQVDVDFHIGGLPRSLSGKCVGYNAEAHHIILDVGDDCFFIRFPLLIRRLRKCAARPVESPDGSGLENAPERG